MADIIVRGAGIFGLSVAWACLKKGARVCVVDPKGVGTGASSGPVGALAPHTPDQWNNKKALQFKSLVMADTFWADIAGVGGHDPGYARIGRWQPLFDDRHVTLARTRSVGAQTYWKGQFTWTVRACHPDLAPAPTGLMIYDTLSARIHPKRATKALANAIVAVGGSIERTAENHRGVEVWATGVAGLSALSAELGTSVGNGVKGQAALLARDLGGTPQIFADTVHIVPHGDGTVAVGSTSERSYDDAHSTDENLDKLIAKARAICPALGQARVIARWAGVRPRARSRAPMLGQHPTRANTYIANGGFKIGFGMAPICAQLMADLILDGVDHIPPGFKPEASLAP